MPQTLYKNTFTLIYTSIYKEKHFIRYGINPAKMNNRSNKLEIQQHML